MCVQDGLALSEDGSAGCHGEELEVGNAGGETDRLDLHRVF